MIVLGNFSNKDTIFCTILFINIQKYGQHTYNISAIVQIRFSKRTKTYFPTSQPRIYQQQSKAMGQKFVIPYPDGSVYEGECDSSDAKPNGKGRVKLADGTLFEGQFVRGRPIEGTLTIPRASSGQVIYEGNFQNSFYHGKGTLMFPTGQKLSGVFQSGELVEGTVKFRNNDYYIGQLNPNTKHFNRQGKFKWSTGDHIKGEFIDGELSGYASVQFHNGDTFEGEFLGGVIHGVGTYTKPKKSASTQAGGQGFIYCGEFVEGRFHGKGKIKYSSGDSYQGDFSANKKQGVGVYRVADGTCYHGQFLEDEINGWCEVYNFPLNSPIKSYIGYVQQKKFEGIGQLVYKDDSVYEGEFKNHKPTGRGRIVYPQGHYIDRVEGYFDMEGRLTGICQVMYANGDRYDGQFRNGVKNGRGRYDYRFKGVVYDGEWSGDKKHGKGKVEWLDTGKVQQAVWICGKRQKVRASTNEQGMYYSGQKTSLVRT